MRILSVGGGPAGLYFAILMKKALPDVEVDVVERNRADDTFGWGVVFSDETLGNFESADPETYAKICSRFRYWRNIETFVHGEKVVSTGHGFAALSRRELLLILQARARDLGARLRFEEEIESTEAFAGYDLVLGADGVNSWVRDQFPESFEPQLDRGRCRFSWLGADLPLDAFTFIFKESAHGLFQVHAYPFEAGRATWIVECREEVWERAGLAAATEEETVDFCEDLFADFLDGHRLLSNRSIWRTFPTVRCASWVHENVVLLGDAAHTAHFSIGSGTKMAMEDAAALVEAFQEHDLGTPARALAAFEDARRVEVLKLQKAAQTSLEWFENSARYLGQSPLQFTFNLMTRSKRVTYDTLRERDPALVRRVDSAYPDWVKGPCSQPPQPPMFTPFESRGLTLANRIVVSPMCQYSAADGVPNDWHLVHLGSRAIGGAGLVMTEMSDVEPEGRITYRCAGMWNDEQMEAWERIVTFVHQRSQAAIGMQLAHAGRKASMRYSWDGSTTPLDVKEGAWQAYAPSAIPFRAGWPVPKAMDRKDMDRVIAAFEGAARRAEKGGFDLVELHMAHGYLLSEFLTPLCNRRTDAYGGDLKRRMRFPLEVFEAVRAVWPDEKPVLVRLTGSDWFTDGSGMTPDDAVEVARALKEAGCDLIDVSSGGNVPDSPVVFGRMYQVPFADKIRYEAQIPVATVGGLLGPDHANTVLAAGRADLAVLARPHLRDPYLTLHAAEDYGIDDPPWPDQYLRGRPPRSS
jgi:anthraniloyl-CoA monooxygenase